MKPPQEWLQIAWQERQDKRLFVRSIQIDALDAAMLAVAEELELPGDMPDEMWDTIRNDRDAVVEALRIAVRQTKSNILQRIAKLKSPY